MNIVKAEEKHIPEIGRFCRRGRGYARGFYAALLDLLTAKDNFPGQHLYEKLGYTKVNEDFFAYSLYTTG